MVWHCEFQSLIDTFEVQSARVTLIINGIERPPSFWWSQHNYPQQISQKVSVEGPPEDDASMLMEFRDFQIKKFNKLQIMVQYRVLLHT